MLTPTMERVTGKPTVLVVDDNRDNCALAQATLEDDDCDVVVAMSGPAALAAFESKRPDCVLLDVRMPGMDGFEVCERIRAMPEGLEIPIVFLTALRDLETFDRALRAGGDDFLTKPIRPAELLVRVQAAVRLRRMSIDLREHYDLVRRQRDDLMRLQLQKERLTSFLVHDLKNPVASMDLHAQALLRNREIPASARASAERIREDARSLSRLIMNLLDIAKDEEGQLTPHLTDIDATALATEVCEALSIRARAQQLELRHDVRVEGPFRGDADLLRRVLENLVDNAVRHAPEGSIVRLSIEGREGGIELCVADQGSGVPAEMREQIFERFVQLQDDEGAVSRAGRGLGLAFCKLVAQAHGGRIWIEDGTPGAMFCLRLPQ
jgi:two-component system sensor histidine kinase/response regulator